MKKILLAAGAGLITQFGFTQTTATDFTTNDCNSVSHTLFTELDAGKVIVMCWVMPCGSCIAPASTDAATVQGYASSNPGQVKFYLLDDNGGTSCSTLSSWASTNSITADAKFSNAGNVIKMTDYGTAGMPKTVVLGGPNHTVFYNVNGTVSASALQTAINNALAATTGIADLTPAIAYVNIFPNPANISSSVSYTLDVPSDVTIEIYNLVGKKVKTVFSGQQTAGEQKVALDCSELNNGMYFVKIGNGKLERTIMLSVAH